MDWYRVVRVLLPLLAGGLMLWMLGKSCAGIMPKDVGPPMVSTGRQVLVHSSVTGFPRGLDASSLVLLIERARVLPDRTVTVPFHANDPDNPSYLLPRPWLAWMMKQGYIHLGRDVTKPTGKLIGFTRAGESAVNPRKDDSRQLWVVPLTATTIRAIESIEGTTRGGYRVTVTWTQELTPLGQQVDTVRSRGEGTSEFVIRFHPDPGWYVERPRNLMPR